MKRVCLYDAFYNAAEKKFERDELLLESHAEGDLVYMLAETLRYTLGDYIKGAVQSVKYQDRDDYAFEVCVFEGSKCEYAYRVVYYDVFDR